MSNDEPILRLPFAKFLANPCGFGSTTERSYALKSIVDRIPFRHRNLFDIDNSEIHLPPASSAPLLAQETFRFLEPFRQQYDNINRSSFTNEELVTIMKEFLLIVQQVKYSSQLFVLEMVISKSNFYY